MRDTSPCSLCFCASASSGAFIHEGVSGGLLASAHRFELALPVSSLAFPLLLLFAAAAGIGELLLKRCNALLMV